jgi:uncharacterized protein
MIDVEVVYASNDKQSLLTVSVLPNATIEDAIIASGILKTFPEIDLPSARVGVFSEKATLQTRLKPGDRVEIYRPLIIDPKEARRTRAKQKV